MVMLRIRLVRSATTSLTGREVTPNLHRER